MRAKRVDDNQKLIVDQLRKIPGVSVLHLHMVGKGCPDIAVGRAGVTYLIELKNHMKRPSEKRLSDDENEFHKKWTGHAAVAETVTEILKIINL